MDRQLPPAAACGISLGGGGTRTAVPGRFGNQPCLPVALPAGRFPGVSMDTMSLDPTRISEDLGGEPAWASFVDCARSHDLRILLDICRITCRRRSTIRGGSRARAWTVQRVRRVLRFQSPAASTFSCSCMFSGLPQERGPSGQVFS